MNQKLIDLIEEVGNLELDEEEGGKIEEALGEKLLLEFGESLESFEENTLEGVVEIGVAKLIQIIVKLATAAEEKEEEEEEGGKKKVEKSPSWSFSLGQKIED